jgi:hypothetical protein
VKSKPAPTSVSKETITTLRDLAARGFLERDEVNQTTRLHPRWVGVPKADFDKALAESFEQYPYPMTEVGQA